MKCKCIKGLIYFTDGYGVYPARMPGYDTIFAFLDDSDERPEVPPWAIPVVLNEDEIEGMAAGGQEDGK